MAFSGPGSEMWSVMQGVNEARCPLNTVHPGRAGFHPPPGITLGITALCTETHTHTPALTHTP